MITQEKQDEILQMVKTIAVNGHQTEEELEERRHLLMVGVLIALGADEIPPYWYLNIQSHATDRLFK